MTGLRGAATVLALLAAAAAAPVDAQDIATLRSTDGAVDFTGELVDFDGAFFTLRTRMGTLRFPADEVSCIGAPCPEANQISSSFRVVGAPSLLRFLMPELLDAYSLTVDTDITRGPAAEGDLLYQMLSFDGDPVVDVVMEYMGADEALAQLAAGEATLAITTRRISEDEAAALTGFDRRAVERLSLERIIGIEGIVAIAGASVGIDTISREDLARVFAGQVTNWSQLGGPDLPISPFTREAGSEARALLEDLIMAPFGDTVGSNVISVDSDDGVVGAVETFPNSLGVAGLGGVGEPGALAVLDACGAPIAASTGNMKSGRYPLITPVYVYKAVEDVPVHAAGLVEFALSGEGQEVVTATGYTSLTPALIADAASTAGAEAGDVAALIADAERMTISFQIGAGAPDIRSRTNLRFLADYIRAGRADGREVVMIGRAADTAAGQEAARRAIDLLFAEGADIEATLSVGFRAAGAATGDGADCAAPPAGSAVPVEVWMRPLSEG
ncbi:MAG: substrate-binding domain-containing protein [Pseudomonadota bacterium]